MVKNSKNPENSQENSDKFFNFKDFDAGVHLPAHLFLFDLLQNNKINSNDFSVFLILLHEAFFVQRGCLEFKFSNADIRLKTGLSKYLVSLSQKKLVHLGLINCSPSKNGNPSIVKINLNCMKRLNNKDQSNGLTGDQSNGLTGGRGDQSNGLTGTSQKRDQHLLEKVLKVSSSYHTKFFDSKKRNLFNRDIRKLAFEGVNIDAIASFLDLEVFDFNHVRSFYGLIDKNRDRLLEIHLEKEKSKIEEASRLQVYIQNQQNAPDLTFKTPAAISEWKNRGNAFKGKSGANFLMHRIDLDNINDLTQN